MTQLKKSVLGACTFIGLGLAYVSYVAFTVCIPQARGAFVCTGFVGLAMAEICVLAILEVL